MSTAVAISASGAASSRRILALTTLAFGVCFAAWVQNGVLVTFLVQKGVFSFSRGQVGWLIGAPILTGSILRIPVGILADRHGGRPVMVAVMLASAVGCLALSLADGFLGFAAASLAFGLAGTSFAVGVAYVSVWFSRERQGTALGVFGVGNLGSALSALGAPAVLALATHDGRDLQAWRVLPRALAGILALVALGFWLGTQSRKPAVAKNLRERLAVLGDLRVWRFGLYYVLLFGGFVALSQWLVPYALNVPRVSLAAAGGLAAMFAIPGGLMRALGGWLSDRYGARATMYAVLLACAAGFALLGVWPSPSFAVFAAAVLFIGGAMGVGMGAVFKHIADYFPGDVGAVGGVVGVMGGLGGFFCPVVFGGLLSATGSWRSCWMVLLVLTAASLAWMHVTVRGLVRRRAADLNVGDRALGT